MQTLAKAALGIALVAVLATLTHERTPEENSTHPPASGSAPPHGPQQKYALVPCPKGQLPDNGVCIPVPSPDAELPSQTGLNGASYLVAKLPERPSNLRRYDFGMALLSGEAGEATLPATARVDPAGRGRAFRFITQASAPVLSAVLEGQQGATTARLVDAVNKRVLTTHILETLTGARHYAIYYANLGAIQATALQALTPRAPLGTTPGDASQDSYLYLDVRRLRRGTSPDGWTFSDYLDDSKTVRVDPRNVFPLE